MENKIHRYLLFYLVILSPLIISNCSNKRINTMTNEEAQISLRLSSQEASDLIKRNVRNKDFNILDVRTNKEYISGHIERSIMIDFNSETFANNLQGLDKNKTYLIYCRSGNRSGKALLLMKEMGFMRVYEIKGGMNDWVNNKFPVVTE